MCMYVRVHGCVCVCVCVSSCQEMGIHRWDKNKYNVYSHLTYSLRKRKILSK